MRADRLISLLMLLQTKGQMTAEDLAARLEVSVRTVYRDLDALSISGVPVYTERGPHGGCALLESYRTNLTGLKEAEVRALFMFTVPGLLEDLGADDASASALLKLTAALPTPFRRSAEMVRQRLHLDSVAWFHPDEPTPHLATVQEALWQERRLRLLYRTGNGALTKMLIEPYGLVAKAGVWYLVGSQKGIYAYRVSRIQAAELTEGQFSYPPDFNLAHFWQEWSSQVEDHLRSYAVTLRVARSGVPLVIKVFGEGARHLLAPQLYVAKDEWASPPEWVELTLHFASAEEACRHLLALGTAVEIVEPVALRAQVAEMAQKVMVHYQR